LLVIYYPQIIDKTEVLRDARHYYSLSARIVSGEKKVFCAFHQATADATAKEGAAVALCSAQSRQERDDDDDGRNLNISGTGQNESNLLSRQYNNDIAM
jgi:hypothetical protein